MNLQKRDSSGTAFGDRAHVAFGCLVLILLLQPVRGVAQLPNPTGVTGTVVQERDGTPVFEAAVRLMHTDGSGVILAGRTDEDGRYLLIFPADRETIPDSALVEAGALGAGIRVSAPFRLEPGQITEAPPLELRIEPIALDTVGVEVSRPWWYIPPPRERVLDRQLRGRGVFRDDIASVEIYREWDEVPEELRFHVYTESFPPPCGLINVWLWDSWNRGIDDPT